MRAPRIAGGLGAATLLGGGVWLGSRVLHAGEQSRTEPAANATPTTHRHGIAGAYLVLDKTAAAAPRDARDPRAFERAFAADGPGWAAADATVSVALPDRRTLWLFGDTLVRPAQTAGASQPAMDFVRNSAVVQDGSRLTTVLGGSNDDPDSFLTPAHAGEWYWPGAATVEGDDVLVFMDRMARAGNGITGWDFESRGTDLVQLDARDLSVTDVQELPRSAKTSWGTALASDERFTYVYGFQGGPDAFDRFAVVARAPKGHVGDAVFEYWDGHRWGTNEAAAAHVADGLSTAFSVLPTPDGRWAMVSQGMFFGTALNVRTADHPQGPWGPWRTIDAGPARSHALISYNALVHPESTADGKLLVSWNMNRADAQIPDARHLDQYRARFRAVDAARLMDPVSEGR